MSSQDVIQLERDGNFSCKVHLFGATVISWINAGEEMLFVSSKSHFDKKKPIRGGIPLVFPNFGPWDIGPQHGFARSNMWKNTEVSKDAAGNPVAVFTLSDTEETRQIWDFKFSLTYTVTLMENSLKTDFSVQNTDSKEFGFTCLLHNYFKVPDVTKVTVSGLKGLHYWSKVTNENLTEDRDFITVAANIDSVYHDTPDEHIITGVAGGHNVSLKKMNLPDTVVWNPWKENAAAMSDFDNDEYPMMLCVEAGFVSRKKVLAAGETFNSSQTITVIQ